MTLEKAVEILNRWKWRGFGDWRAYRDPDPLCPPYAYADGPCSDEYVTAFEAVAVAEKYQREREEGS